MTNVAKKFEMSKEARLKVAHKAIMPKKYHVESVEARNGSVIADVVNEADPNDEYHYTCITNASLFAFIELEGLNGSMFDSIDQNGEPMSEWREEMPAREYMEKNAKEVVTLYLNAGKDLRAC